MEYTELFGNYVTMTFNDIYPSKEDFMSDYNESGLITSVTTSNMHILYNLLYAEFKNSHIINADVYQFKARLFSTIFQYAPTWEKKLEYQKKIRDLEEADLIIGSKVVHNHAFNPSSSPSTSSLEGLSYIDEQNATNYKNSKLDAYVKATMYLEQNFTKELLDKFNKLFIKIAEPNEPLIYEVDY